MAVIRQTQFLANSRVDSPFLRSIDSGVAADFDVLAGVILAGKQPLITNGFNLITTGVTNATQLQIKVANGSLIHYMATDSGSIFSVPSNQANETLTSTNPNVSGGFTPSQVNYVGIDLVRMVDDTTADLVMFIDSSSLAESPKEVPLAIILKYRIVISTIDFNSTPTVAPIAKVTTSSSNAIVLVEDARNIFWRLGSGGTAPNAKNVYQWPTARNESSYIDLFLGGDKTLGSLKNWLDAAMSRIWEVGGGEYWYSPTADRNVKMVTQGTPFTNGEFFTWTSNNLNWKGVLFLFDNSTGYKNEVADQTSNSTGLTDLADGDCIYVDLDRTQNLTGGNGLTAVRSALTTLGPGPIPGSRYIIAWRSGNNIFTRIQQAPIGQVEPPATTASIGAVAVSATPITTLAPFAVLFDTNTQNAIAAGLSRGNTGNGFPGGGGGILIGGGSNDTSINISTTGNSNYTKIGGTHTDSTRGTLEVVENTAMVTGTETAAIKAIGYDNTLGYQTGVWLQANGVIGLRKSTIQVQTPANTTADPIEVKIFLVDNGLPSGETRNRLVIMDTTGITTTLWEGPLY